MGEYSLLDPSICGYYRSAVYLVSTYQELVPTLEQTEISSFIEHSSSSLHILNTTNESDNEAIVGPRTSTPKKEPPIFIPMEEGFTGLQQLFGNYYDCHELQYNIFKKNIHRFKDANKKWSRANAEKKNIYYNLFSPVNWQNLLDSEKNKT